MKKELIWMNNSVATLYYSLNQAVKHRTSSGNIPFLIAEEVCEPYRDSAGDTQIRTRVFYAFDNIQDFTTRQDRFTHAHEVVWDRFAPGKQQGRLVFDFDFTQPWAGVRPHFVPHDFQTRIQEVVIATFEKFYTGVDTTKFVWVWLVSDTESKWSKHLIVKNAYFSHDWKAQILVFYNLFLSMASQSGYFSITPIEDLIDSQVARHFATMRMCGSSKLGGKVLRLESPQDATFEDTLIQLYDRKVVRAEQAISESQLRKDVLNTMFYEHPEVIMKDRFLKAACEKCYIDLSSYYESGDFIVTRDMVNSAFEAFETQYCEHFHVSKQDVFKMGSVSGQFVVLSRVRSAPCWLSGRVHDAENACLIVSENCIQFYCRRDCIGKDGSKCIRIFKTVSE